MVSLSPRRARNRPISAYHAPPAAMPASPPASQASGTACGASWDAIGTATTEAARAPSASAPSAPMTTRPACAGRATANPVRISGAARNRVFCQANELAKPPSAIVANTTSGLCPIAATKSPKAKSPASTEPTGTSQPRSQSEPAGGRADACSGARGARSIGLPEGGTEEGAWRIRPGCCPRRPRPDSSSSRVQRWSSPASCRPRSRSRPCCP